MKRVKATALLLYACVLNAVCPRLARNMAKASLNSYKSSLPFWDKSKLCRERILCVGACL